MTDDSTLTKTEVKQSQKNKVIPISSITDLSTVVGDIQNQLSFLLNKLNNDVSPEFKALMEGYVNKANEAEEIKVKLENFATSQDEFKAEIVKIRETNRNLIYELQSARESLTKLELEFNSYQESVKRTEDNFKDKLKKLTKQNLEYESKIKLLEDEKSSFNGEQEKIRQELLDQNFNFSQLEQELTIERDNLQKQVDEFEILIKEQTEKLELKTKEAEYKDALLNQLVKKATTEKVKLQGVNEEPLENEVMDKPRKKRKVWFFD